MSSTATHRVPQVSGSQTIWLVCALGALAMFEIPLVNSLLIVVVLLVIGFFGRELYRVSGVECPSVGASLVLGVGVQVFLSLILTVIGVSPAFSQWMAITILGGLSLVAWRRNASLEEGAKSLSTVDIFPSLSITLIALSLRHPWVLPYSLVVAAVERTVSKRSSASTMRSFAVAMPFLFAGFLLATFLRSNRWWYLYLTGDSGYFESIAWNTSFWGLGEHPGLSGGSIAGYHWLSYAFLGSLSQLASLEPWVALTKIGLPLLQFAMASILLRVPYVKSHSPPSIVAWTISLLVVVGTGKIRYDSTFFGLVSVLCILGTSLTIATSTKTKPAQLLVMFLVSVTAVMSKTPAAIAISTVLGLGLVSSYRKLRLRLLMPLMMVASAGIICYVIFFHGSAYGAAADAPASNSLSTVVWTSINGVPYLSWVSVTTAIYLVLSIGKVSEVGLKTRILMTSSIICWLLFSALSVVADYAHQTADPSLFLVGAIAAWGIQSTLEPQKPATLTSRLKLLTILSLALGAGTGFVLPVVYNRVNASVKLSDLLGANAWEFISDQLIYLIPLVVVGFALRRPRETRTFHLAVSLSLCLGLAAGLQLDRARRVATWGPDVAVNWALNDSALPSDDLRAVGTYVRRNTAPDAIIATNDFCCFGSEWWREIANNPEQHRSGSLKWWSTLERTQWWKNLENQYGVDFITKSVTDTLWGGDNYLIAAETRRRVLIQGLKFQVLTGLPTQDQVNRMTLSLEFANNPSGLVVDQLRGYGVSGYIVNLKLTSQRSWSEFADELYRSGDFVYLELR